MIQITDPEDFFFLKIELKLKINKALLVEVRYTYNWSRST